MMAAAASAPLDHAPHIPVLLRPLLRAIAPVEGVWLDGTFGAGGYSRALLEAGLASAERLALRGVPVPAPVPARKEQR